MIPFRRAASANSSRAAAAAAASSASAAAVAAAAASAAAAAGAAASRTAPLSCPPAISEKYHVSLDPPGSVPKRITKAASAISSVPTKQETPAHW